MNDLVSKASTAYINAYGKTLMTFDERHLEAMTAAAKVLLEAALGDVGKEEWLGNRHMTTKADICAMTREQVNDLFANRKARILGPKTIEERVTIVSTNIASYSNVLLDGKSVGPGSMRNDYAQTFAKGLIAGMKEKG